MPLSILSRLTFFICFVCFKLKHGTHDALFFDLFLVSMEEFLDVASTRLPTLRGVKFTDTNLFEFGRCVTAQEGRYQIIFGCDEVQCAGGKAI